VTRSRTTPGPVKSDREPEPIRKVAPARFSVHPREHRIRFGDSITEVLGEELTALGASAPLLISSERGAAVLEQAFIRSGKALPYVDAFTETLPHVPDRVARAAERLAVRTSADCIVAFGGGSALDTAKAVAHERPVPIIAVPTTLSGSEVTFNFGLTIDGVKQTIVDADVLARVVVYDPALFQSLAPMELACSGMNALAHAVEALYSTHANPLTTSIASAGIEHMLRGLRPYPSAASLDAITDCMYGAWLCGEALAQVGMGLHHRLCHVLGGTFALPHAPTHTVLLPYVAAFNEPWTETLRPPRRFFDGENLALGLRRLAEDLGAPMSLQSLGLPEEAIEHAADLALARPVDCPRQPTRPALTALLRRAWSGAALDE
jgi:maleylacetate reductase